MLARSTRSLATFALAAASLVAATGCPKKLPGGPNVPDVPGGMSGGSSEVDPNTCGNYAVSDAGRKLHAFLAATVELQTALKETEEVEKTSCKMMGQELQMAPGDLEGTTQDVCARVFTTLRDDLKVKVTTQPALVVEFKPGVCTVDANAQASAAAECEGSASGSATTGTAGSSSSGGAAGQCAAAAHVHASLNATCTEPQLKITLQKPAVVDVSRAELAVHAMTDGLPKIFSVSARIKILSDAITQWAAAGAQLAQAGASLAQSFKDQAMCISGQLAALASAVTNVQASFSVQVHVSVEAEGSISSK
jgi:hypothetical protein